MNDNRPHPLGIVVSVAAAVTVVITCALLAWFYATRPTPWTAFLVLGLASAALVGRIALVSTRTRH